MVLDFCPFGCLLSSFSAAFGRFPSFWLPFVFLFGCLLSLSVLLAAFCFPFRLLLVDFRPFGCLLSSLWLPWWACFSLCSPLNIGFEIYGFGLPFVLAAFCLPFRLLFVDFRPFGYLLFSHWLPCWACCSFRSPLNIGFEIYGFGFLFGSVARNDHFGTFFFEIWRKPRTKRSFWNLFL